MDNEQSTKSHIERLVKEHDGPDLSPVREQLVNVLNGLFESLHQGYPDFLASIYMWRNAVPQANPDLFPQIWNAVADLEKTIGTIVNYDAMKAAAEEMKKHGFTPPELPEAPDTRITADMFKPFLRVVGKHLLAEYRKKNNLQ